jgi:hypothetical protein
MAVARALKESPAASAACRLLAMVLIPGRMVARALPRDPRVALRLAGEGLEFVRKLLKVVLMLLKSYRSMTRATHLNSLLSAGC